MYDAKGAFPSGPDGQPRATEAMSVAILEGIDLRDSEAALDMLRGPHYGATSDEVGRVFRWTLDAHADLMTGMRDLKKDGSGLAKSVLHRLIEAESDPADPEKAFNEALRLHGLRGEHPLNAAQVLAALPGPGAARHLRLKAAAEFWDYVDPLEGLPARRVMEPTP